MDLTSVTLQLAGTWTSASLVSGDFTASYVHDMSTVLGPRLATAIFADSPAIDAGTSNLILVLNGWGDSGTFIDRLLAAATWTGLQDYYTTAFGSAPPSPFVVSSVRARNYVFLLGGGGWGDATALPSATIITDLIADIASLDATASRFTGATNSGSIVRTATGATVPITISTDGVQSELTLLQAATYATLRARYNGAVAAQDFAFNKTDLVLPPSSTMLARFNFALTFTGSWQLVLQQQQTAVEQALADAITAALGLSNATYVILPRVTTGPYPFNLIATIFIVAEQTASTAVMAGQLSSGDYSALVALYGTSGGDASTSPVILTPMYVPPPALAAGAMKPITTNHVLHLNGNRWAIIVADDTTSSIARAVEADVVTVFLLLPVTVTVTSVAAGADGTGYVALVVAQGGVNQLRGEEVDSLFASLTNLTATFAAYTTVGYMTPGTSLYVISSRVVRPSNGSPCKAKCIGMSAMAGGLLLMTILIGLVFCCWHTFLRYVPAKSTPHREMVTIQREHNPFVGMGLPPYASKPVDGPSFAREATMVSSMSGTSNPAAFGPQLALSSAKAPEARMTSFVPSEPHSSIVRQSNIVIPTSTGERDFEIVVIPRGDYEAQLRGGQGA